MFQSTILLLTTTLKLLKLFSTASLTSQLEFLLQSLLFVLHHMLSGLTSSHAKLKLSAAQAHYSALLFFCSSIDSISVPSKIQPLISNAPFLTLQRLIYLFLTVID